LKIKQTSAGPKQAYRRSDALEKRRKLMDASAAYCEPKTSANVVQMSKQNSSRAQREP
jgi:hypothetical protein